jgi:hypothetical protein
VQPRMQPLGAGWRALARRLPARNPKPCRMGCSACAAATWGQPLSCSGAARPLTRLPEHGEGGCLCAAWLRLYVVPPRNQRRRGDHDGLHAAAIQAKPVRQRPQRSTRLPGSTGHPAGLGLMEPHGAPSGGTRCDAAPSGGWVTPGQVRPRGLGCRRLGLSAAPSLCHGGR